ncbi:hypothetical protein ACN28E_40470 [Archangium lansingense]|uniref:hypothetical protein n=1 Tax=Archangium lansingense TaxID=2995310 RepID=UPI003B7B1A85
MSSRIQWVNLPEKTHGDDSEQKRKYLFCNEIKDVNDMGRTIFIQAEFDSKAASAIATLEVIPDPGNAVFSETEAAGAAAIHAQAAIQSDGKAEFAVRLSTAGGDKFKFKAHDTNGTVKELSDQFETRRLLYFQVFKIKGTSVGAGALTHMKNEFANGANSHKHHITLVQLGSEQEVDGPPIVDGSPPGHSVGDYIKSSRDSGKDPYCFSVLFVDQIAEPVEDKSDYPVDVDNDPDLNELPIYSTKGPLWSVGNTPEEQERKLWLKEAYFLEASGRRLRIEPAQIKAQAPDSKGRVFSFVADLSGLPKGTKGKAHFVFLGSDFTNGFSPRGKGFICVAARSCWDPRTESSITATLMHEAGHKLGMVPVGQSTHYNENNTGRHCRHEINQCLMFGRQHLKRSNSFCPVCSESLRKMDLDTRGNVDFTPP